MRNSYLAQANYLCERCIAKGEVIAATQVHHKIRLTPQNINDPSISLNHDNLEALCDACHASETFKHDQKSKSVANRYLIDAQGRMHPPGSAGKTHPPHTRP